MISPSASDVKGFMFFRFLSFLLFFGSQLQGMMSPSASYGLWPDYCSDAMLKCSNFCCCLRFMSSVVAWVGGCAVEWDGFAVSGTEPCPHCLCGAV